MAQPVANLPQRISTSIFLRTDTNRFTGATTSTATMERLFDYGNIEHCHKNQ
jgi:hypothetical protein